MASGVFGVGDTDLPSKKTIARRLLERELGLGDRVWRKRNNGILAQVCVFRSLPQHQGPKWPYTLSAIYLLLFSCFAHVYLILTLFSPITEPHSRQQGRKDYSL